jgi:alcohol dehydrogenase
MLLPKYYEFCARVKTLAGHKALEKIPEALLGLKAKKPMIITDKGVVQAGLIKIVTGAMKGSKVKIGAIVDNVPPDSEFKVVNETAKVYRKNGCDAIIAVGGGSVMDTSKGVNILVSLGGDDIMDFEGSGAVKERLKPMIAIPTTSGTGSEVTQAAVIANHEKKIKVAFMSYFLLPNIAVLDSRMTRTLPPFLTASTGMDALTHACEAYFCLAKNPLSDGTALVAIQLISQNLLNVVKNPNDLDGRLKLAIGATLAGMSFSNSMVGLVHNLGHATGGACGVPHGTCMSLYLPYGLEYSLHKTPDYIGELLFPLAGEEVYAATPKKERPQKAIDYIRQMNQDLHDATGKRHARFLSEVLDRNGNQMVTKDKLPVIAKTSTGDGAHVYNPEHITYDDALMVLEHAWDGRPLDRKKIKKGRKIKY